MIVGRVMQPGGRRGVDTGTVALTRIRGDVDQFAFSGQDRVQYAESDLDDGDFFIYFSWSGAEIAEGIMNLSLDLYAGMEEKVRNGFRTIASKRVTTRGHVIESIVDRASLALPIIQSWPDLLGFSKSLIEGYRKIKSVPLPDVKWMSSECKLMIGAALIQL